MSGVVQFQVEVTGVGYDLTTILVKMVVILYDQAKIFLIIIRITIQSNII